MSRVRNAAWAVALVLLCAWVVGPAAAFAQPAQGIDIPYKKFVLKNGLTLLVHEDHKAPIVAVNVWYHVGSKNEKPGRTGFAHLFEHLMFNGSEHFNDDYFKVLERLGATDLNGTTNEDRTNYFQNVPTSGPRHRALDGVGPHGAPARRHHAGEARRAARRRPEREAPGRERALRQVDLAMVEATFPKGHPYSWTVIGSMEDLNAASLDDVKEWFKDVLRRRQRRPRAGRRHRRGDGAARRSRSTSATSPPGPPVTKHQAWIAKRTGEQRQIMEDRVPQARLYMVWNVPQWGIGRRGSPRPGGERPLDRQDVAPLQAAGLRRADRHQRDGRARRARDREPVLHHGARRGRAPTSRRWRRPFARSWRRCSRTARRPPSWSASRRSAARRSSAASSASAASAASPTCSRRARCTPATPRATR